MSAPSRLKFCRIVLKVAGVPLLFQAPHCFVKSFAWLEILRVKLCSNSKSDDKGPLLRDSVSAPFLLPRKPRVAFFSCVISNLITTRPWSMW